MRGFPVCRCRESVQFLQVLVNNVFVFCFSHLWVLECERSGLVGRGLLQEKWKSMVRCSQKNKRQQSNMSPFMIGTVNCNVLFANFLVHVANSPTVDFFVSL